MKTGIFYFTGTGNSLNIARQIKENMGGEVDLINIAIYQQNPTPIDYEKVGFVFPVYWVDIPKIVQEFIKSTDFGKASYFFGITNCGQFAGYTLFNLKNLLQDKGKDLNYSKVLIQPENYIVMYNAKPEDKQKELFAKTKEEIKEISVDIINNKNNSPDKLSLLNKTMDWIIRKPYQKMFALNDQLFTIENKCNSCGVCEKVCPRQNIQVENGKRKWKGNCEECMACIQLCPQEAIQYKNKTQKHKRYHHPDVKVVDLFVNV